MKRFLILSFVAAVGVAVVPARAAVYMKSHLHGTGPDGRPNEAVEMQFEGWFEGDRAVIEILSSANEMFGQGKIFIDGSEMTLYDPQENTCTPWDVQAMMRFAGAVLESTRGIIDLEFGTPEVEVLERKSGLSLLGRRVDYIKYRSNWTMSLKMPLMKKRTFDNSTLQELWYDEDLLAQLPAAGVFMDPESFSTGYEEMDAAIAAGMPPVKGAVLKSVAVSTVVNQKGKEETTTSINEVQELDLSAAAPAGGYSAPEDCRVVAMLPPTGADGGEEAEAADAESADKKPWSKVKVKNPFKKKDKDDG